MEPILDSNKQTAYKRTVCQIKRKASLFGSQTLSLFLSLFWGKMPQIHKRQFKRLEGMDLLKRLPILFGKARAPDLVASDKLIKTALEYFAI
jgi:hypothetical protein